MKNLNVPYKSQWDDDATATVNDCGPASIAMILSFYNKELSTNDVFYASGAGQGYVTFAQMTKAIADYGFKYDILNGQSIAKLKSLIDQGLPPIALIHYGALSSRQDKGFTGAHFVVVRGYDDNNYYVNDPDFWGNYRADGDNHIYTKKEFEEAWSTASIEGNPNNSLIVIYKDETTPTTPGTTTCEINLKQLQKDFDDLIIDRNKLNDIIGKVKDPLISRWNNIATILKIDPANMDRAPELCLTQIETLQKSVASFPTEKAGEIAKANKECQVEISNQRSDMEIEFNNKILQLKKDFKTELDEAKKGTVTVYKETPPGDLYKGVDLKEKIKIIFTIFFA